MWHTLIFHGNASKPYQILTFGYQAGCIYCNSYICVEWKQVLRIEFRFYKPRTVLTKAAALEQLELNLSMFLLISSYHKKVLLRELPHPLDAVGKMYQITLNFGLFKLPFKNKLDCPTFAFCGDGPFFKERKFKRYEKNVKE